MNDIVPVATKGIESLLNVAPVVTVLVLVNLILIYFIRALLIDAREERNLYRQTLEETTKTLTRLEGVINVAISIK